MRRGDLSSGNGEPSKSWPSIVMLLRRAQNRSAEELSSLADAAWGMNDAHGRISPKIVETGKDRVVFALAPSIHVSIIQVDQPYSAAMATENAHTETRKDTMWKEHTSWCAVDIPNRYDLPTKERRECYLLLLHFVNKVWGPDVNGLYLPAEQNHRQPAMPSQIPNVGDLLASVKRSGTNQSSSGRTM
jgi:hypothetical protein